MSSFLIDIHSLNLEGIGGKAKNLIELEKIGAKVPEWIAIPERILLDQLNNFSATEEISEKLKSLEIPAEIIAELDAKFGNNKSSKSYAVRSSATDEDGLHHSFAGQYETFLNVPFEELPAKIKALWQTVVSERVLTYRRENNLDLKFGLAVIVQEMIDADVAGVAFGVNPVNGDEDAKVISSTYGLGEGLVSGDLDADTFILKNGSVETQLAEKKKMVSFATNGGVVKTEVPSEKYLAPSLTDNQLKEIAGLLDRLRTALGTAQDIEFAIKDDILYLLQTRPVTAVGNKPEGEYILWDNSNIIESYPGITTPLTFSFIIKMYEQVYRQFVGLMGVKEREVDVHKEVFANTLGLVRGRVYYNLLSWYKMLAMVPGYSINAEFMENMMGVKERFELKEDFRMNKGLAWWRIISMVFKMIGLQRRLPKERVRFLNHLNKTMNEYKAIPFDSLSSKEIIQHYLRFERTLLLEWKAPLINDFFAMIWFGMLQKQTKKYCHDNPNIHNDLLCGSSDIISVEPVHKSLDMVKYIVSLPELKDFIQNNSADEVWEGLKSGRFPELMQKVQAYLDQFGDRCVGELKLETISYHQHPALYLKQIKAYVDQGITERKRDTNIEEELRVNAENHMNELLKGKGLKRWWFNKVLRNARDLVSNRENLRYERTRGFGMVRVMFNALGQKWYEEGNLENPRDIFFLKLEEIKSCGESSFNLEWKERIKERKAEFDAYEKQDPPMERFFTYGNNFSDEYIYSKEKLEAIEGDLTGIGCCPGIVEGKVMVVRDPNEIDSLNGAILVTSSTDPGWITLFPTASAIIVERGSLLSHSAIVSREMGIPCIVSVKGLLRTLNTGDLVRMNGSTGIIQILENE